VGAYGDEGDAPSVVDAAFAAAAAFFERLGAEKARARWRSGALRKHAGFRREGPRELFAVRADEGGGDGAGWPEAEWRALFRLQRALARDLFALLAAGAGACGGVGAGGLAALFGEDGGGAPPALPAAAGAIAAAEGCADVLRVYRYLRAVSEGAPGLRAAATGAHTDVGLLTLAPLSTVPGLVSLSPCGGHWVDVEGGEEARRARAPPATRRFVAFLGEAGARALAEAARGGAAEAPQAQPLRAPVHFVLEREGGAPRFSAPFFLRAPQHAELAPGMSNGAFLMALAQRPWARLRDRDQDPVAWASDF
jgi:isopenicillin N synthase-like dioxygenase